MPWDGVACVVRDKAGVMAQMIVGDSAWVMVGDMAHASSFKTAMDECLEL